MPVTIFTLEKKDKDAVVDKLIEKSSPRQEFFLMMVLSAAMAAFGLIFENPVVIIGSMLVAPLLSPILSLALGIVASDFALLTRSLKEIGKAVALAIIAAGVIALFFGAGADLSAEITSRAQPSIWFAGVAFIAGLAASLAYIKPNLLETLPGVAVSVSLIPPLAVTGIGIAKFDWALISGSLLLFFINIVGVVFGGMIIFSLGRFYGERGEAQKAVKEEEKEIKKEKAKAEKEMKK